MKLNIEIIADSDNATDMAALAALIGQLGGRVAATMPEVATSPNVQTTSTTTTGPASEHDDSAETVDVGAPDRDSAGYPWDERIHAASKATNADGTWRKRRNLDDATYEAVMAELIAAQVAANPTPPSSPDTPPPPPPEPAATAPAAVAAEPASDSVPPPPPATGPDLSTFANFVRAVNDKTLKADGTPVAPDAKSYAKLNELCSSTFGVPAFKDMKDHPQHWAMFYDMVG